MKELEMILAAVAQLGEAGKEAFIWWLVMDRGLGFITIVCVLVAILVGVRWAITALSFESDVRRIRDALEIGSSGYVTPAEIKAIHAKISLLVNK